MGADQSQVERGGGWGGGDEGESCPGLCISVHDVCFCPMSLGLSVEGLAKMVFRKCTITLTTGNGRVDDSLAHSLMMGPQSWSVCSEEQP